MTFEWQQLKTGKSNSNTDELTDPQWALVPMLANTAEGIEWFANAPPLYLHASAGRCGSLELPGVSQEHLVLLMQAPPIAQSAFARHEKDPSYFGNQTDLKRFLEISNYPAPTSDIVAHAGGRH